METEIKSYINTKSGLKVITIFGYASRGVPGLEINGVGKLSKNIKEKLIYLTRIRKLKLPTKKFVVCLDLNDLEDDLRHQDFKSLEFPILLLFWYLAGFIPIHSLSNCFCAGWITAKGDIFQSKLPRNIKALLLEKLNPVEVKDLRFITTLEDDSDFLTINSEMLLEHIQNLKFKVDYIDKDSAIPIKSFIA